MFVAFNRINFGMIFVLLTKVVIFSIIKSEFQALRGLSETSSRTIAKEERARAIWQQSPMYVCINRSLVSVKTRTRGRSRLGKGRIKPEVRNQILTREE